MLLGRVFRLSYGIGQTCFTCFIGPPRVCYRSILPPFLLHSISFYFFGIFFWTSVFFFQSTILFSTVMFTSLGHSQCTLAGVRTVRTRIPILIAGCRVWVRVPDLNLNFFYLFSNDCQRSNQQLDWF